jgi:WD40 repeat protein
MGLKRDFVPSNSEHPKRRWRLSETRLFVTPLLVLSLVFGWTKYSEWAKSRQEKQTLPAFYIASALAFSPDNSILAGGEGSASAALKLWHLKKGNLLHTIKTNHNAAVWRLAFSPDSKMVATVGHSDGRLFLWDVETANKSGQLMGAQSETNSLFFSPDGKLLIAAGENSTVEIWNVPTRTLLHMVQEPGGKMFAALLPNGKTLLTTSNSGIKLRDLRTSKLLLTLSGSSGKECLKATLSPNGKTLALGTRPGQGQAETIELWDVQNGKLLRTLPENQGLQGASWNSALQALAFSPDSKVLASSSANQEIRLRDVQTGKVLHTLQPYASSLAFSPDGKTLAAGCQREVYLWNLEALQAK